MRRIWCWAGLLACIVSMGMAVTASPAHARTVCRTYDGFSVAGAVPKAGYGCVGNADDYPNFSGHGYIGHASIDATCDSVLPADVDEPKIAACPAAAPLVVWSWDGRAWQQRTIRASSTPAWIYPFVPGWRWAWTDGLGWTAVASADAYVHWFAGR